MEEQTKKTIQDESSLGRNQIKSKKNLYFILLGSIVSLAILLSVLLVIYQFNENKTKSVTNPPTSSPIAKITESYRIIEGSLYKIENGKPTILVNKKDLHFDELKPDIWEIESFVVSPDNSKILLFTNVGISPYAVFFWNKNTKKVIQVAIAESALWSPNSQYIAYTVRPADVGPARLGIYDVNDYQSINPITPINQKYTDYRNIRWASDSASLTADFVRRDDVPYGNQIASGEAVIRMK